MTPPPEPQLLEAAERVAHLLAFPANQKALAVAVDVPDLLCLLAHAIEKLPREDRRRIARQVRR